MLATMNSTTSRVNRTLRALVAVGALAVLALPTIYLATTRHVVAGDANKAAQGEPADEFLPPLSPSEEKILAVLDETTTMDFTETPLQDAVGYLSDLHEIPVRLDTKALEDIGVSSDTPFTYRVNGVRLKSGLRPLLRQKDLTYLVRDEVLLITTEDVAEMELLTRTYPVGDLVDQEDGKKLVEAITTTVFPMSWDEAGGPASIVYLPRAKSLVISQTADRHGEILELLRSLRVARKSVVETIKN